MTTTLPRVQVSFEPNTYQILEELSKAKHEPLSSVVEDLVEKAIALLEDLALAEFTEKRLASFRRDDALSTEDLLKWNKSRKKK